jgi:hypothetical protein
MIPCKKGSQPTREKDTGEASVYIDKQSQIAEQKTVGEQGPGDRSKEAA